MPSNHPYITLSYVSSLDGKITKGNDPYVHNWASKEDQSHFTKLIKEHPVIIISSKTYEVIKQNIKHQAGKLRIVMTRNPQQYKSETIPGMLEFTSDSPKKILQKLSKKGIKKILLAGGSILTNLFFKEKLVDCLILTLEPKIFGEGIPLIAPSSLKLDLQLISMKKLNRQGTILLTYKIKY